MIRLTVIFFHFGVLQIMVGVIPIKELAFGVGIELELILTQVTKLMSMAFI
jgi:hypothetical protein